MFINLMQILCHFLKLTNNETFPPAARPRKAKQGVIKDGLLVIPVTILLVSLYLFELVIFTRKSTENPLPENYFSNR